MPKLAAWSSADVILRLLRAARGVRSKLGVVGYYLARSRYGPRLPGALHDRTFAISMTDLAGPLHCSAESGGLAVYYEIVSRSIYAPTPDWVPHAGDTVVDCGANIGVFALWAAHQVGPAGTVLAYEPNPLAVRMLESSTRDCGQVRVSGHALGERRAAAQTLWYPEGRLSVGSFDERPDRTKSVSVDIVCLDEALAEVPGAIALLKIDVEGFEPQVLRGASRTLERTTRLVLEVAGSSLDECEQLVNAHGLLRKHEISGMWNISRRNGMIACFTRD